MISKYYRIRIFLLTLALGLALVTFFKSIYRGFVLTSINLPQVNSNNPIIVSLEKMPFGGGSGPDGSSEPQKTINTLGTSTKPHIVENADVQRIKIFNADFIAARIENSDFSEASLREANFSTASIIYSSFISTNLKGSDFTGAKLFGSDLTDANFSDAKLIRANFAHSDFSNAVLKNADLTDTNLSDSRLETAKGLTYKQISKAIINEFTSLPARFESKRSILLEHSRQRMKELKKQMPTGELDLFSNEFDFLD